MKVCKRHQQNPVWIYSQCIGCEIEDLRNRVKYLKERVEDQEKRLTAALQGGKILINK